MTPSSSKTMAKKFATFNARSETVGERATFRESINVRCHPGFSVSESQYRLLVQVRLLATRL
ncbi:hypothetical protein [Arthrobacter sp. STN4]|uniref:hypothetical protein n=1 Tax=Arthrobacter sp. STN4 TaxID=2923276 RepID=UPI0035C16CAB